MLAEISAFRWYVFSDGYKCVDHTYRGETFRSVVPKWHDDEAADDGSIGEGNLIERYPLEEEPGLCRSFAGLELTEEAILAFANKWGPLENIHELDPDESENTMSGYRGDHLDSWFRQIKRMRTLVELWDVLHGKTEKKLSDVIEVNANEQLASWWVDVVFKNEPGLKHGLQIRERDRPGFFDLLDMGGKRELARMCLVDLVNDSLWGTCSPFLRVGEEPGEVTLCFAPHNLVSALWLALAQEILGEKNLKQCVHCKRYFEVAGESKERRQRSDRKYCSPKCRAAAFQDRHKEEA